MIFYSIDTIYSSSFFSNHQDATIIQENCYNVLYENILSSPFCIHSILCYESIDPQESLRTEYVQHTKHTTPFYPHGLTLSCGEIVFYSFHIYHPKTLMKLLNTTQFQSIHESCSVPPQTVLNGDIISFIPWPPSISLIVIQFEFCIIGNLHYNRCLWGISLK